MIVHCFSSTSTPPSRIRGITYLVPTFAALYVLYWCLRAIYRLYFHPLASYPGSKLAAVSTEWYEWYWNLYRKGQLLFEIEALHEIHGPVIRIGVNELHINDPEIFLDITKTGSKFLKEPQFYRGISCPSASIGLIDPVQHRVRRQLLAPAFSLSQVQELSQSVIRPRVEFLTIVLLKKAGSGTVNLADALKCFTLDVISEIVFGQRFDALSSEDFSHPQLETLHETVEGAWVYRCFPQLTKFSLVLPEWISSLVFSVPIREFSKYCRTKTEQYLLKRQSWETQPVRSNVSKRGSLPRQQQEQSHSSFIMERLLSRNAVKGHVVPGVPQLNEEALMLLTAGNDTTANAMIFGTYYICGHPEVKTRLEAELVEASPDPNHLITYDEARRLPYLTATIKEILRCAHPLPGRLPRIVPSDGYQLYDKRLPFGTIVHTSAYLLNRHDSIWGGTRNDFQPSRWLSSDASHLDKYVASFYKGSRQCLGINLAWCELYVVLSMLFRQFEVTMPNVTGKDPKWTDHLLVMFDPKDFEVLLQARK